MRKKDSQDVLRKRVVIQSLIFLGIVLFFVFIALHFTFSSGLTQYVERNEFMFGTIVRLVVASEKRDPRIIMDAMVREMRRIERKFNPYVEDSIIYRINHAGGQWVEVDEETIFVLKKALYYSKKTGGAFDPVLGRLIVLWGFNDINASKHVPSDEELQAALKQSGWVKLEISGRRVRVNGGAWIDLGGIVKGYAVDQAVRMAKDMDDTTTGFVDAGGDIGIIGPKFGRYPWKIGIRDPRGGQDDIVGVIYLSNGAVATSGDYERYFEENGVRYHHILDPKTGYPARKAISVTVIGEKLVDADALSTAIFVLGWGPVIEGFEADGYQVMLIDTEGVIHETQGFKYFKKSR